MEVVFPKVETVARIQTVLSPFTGLTPGALQGLIGDRPLTDHNIVIVQEPHLLHFKILEPHQHFAYIDKQKTLEEGYGNFTVLQVRAATDGMTTANRNWVQITGIHNDESREWRGFSLHYYPQETADDFVLTGVQIKPKRGEHALSFKGKTKSAPSPDKKISHYREGNEDRICLSVGSNLEIESLAELPYELDSEGDFLVLRGFPDGTFCNTAFELAFPHHIGLTTSSFEEALLQVKRLG